MQRQGLSIEEGDESRMASAKIKYRFLQNEITAVRKLNPRTQPYLNPILRKASLGFTMIELLMTIAIIAILGATAIPQFLDFRNEAKAAYVQQALSTMRTAIKNQVNQARLKCGADPSAMYGGFNFYFVLGFTMYFNDTTYVQGLTPYCTEDHLPNPEDRKFWVQVSEDQRARLVVTGIDYGPNGNFNKNPFFIGGISDVEEPLLFSNNSDFAVNGACGAIAFYAATYNQRHHWVYNADTGEIFAGTNTAGINECTF